MNRKWGILGLALCLAAAPTHAASESAGGRIEGRVVRADGAGVGGVVVVVNETSAVVLTDATGRFSFVGVPAGVYSLSYTLGDNADTDEGIEVVAGRIARVDKEVDWRISFAETITVVSASRRLERIVEAPSAITVVGEEDIAQQAAHGQLPKLIEFTPGAEVTQSGIYDYNINTRGFNSSLNRRVATLIDGRDPSVPFLGAQEWAAVSFPLDDLASAEVVRGPSAALYGANASSGVINLITKAPRHSQGGQLRLTAGELSTLNADFRWAASLGKEWYVKVLGGLRDHGDFTVSRNGKAEYAVPCGGAVVINCLPQEAVPVNPEDDDAITFAGLRFDKYFGNGAALTVEGGQADIEGPAFQTGIGRVQLVDSSRPWYRVNFNTIHFNALGYQTTRDAPRQTALSSGANLALDTERIGFEVQTNWDFAQDKARVVFGASLQDEDIDSFDPTTGRQSLMFGPVTNEKTAFFGQLDWNLSDKVKLVLAGRYDESDLHDSQVSPKAALVYSINPNHTLRATYNEAFQVANYSEFFLQAPVAPPIPLRLAVLVAVGVDLQAAFCTPFGVDCGFDSIPLLAVGNKDLQLEEVETIELGYSGILGDRAYLTVDYYASSNSNFITDLIPQFTAQGVTNPNFGSYQPPSAIPAPVAQLLLATLASIPGFPFPVLTNNLDGRPFIIARSYANFGEVDTEGIDIGLNYYASDKLSYQFSASWFDFQIQRQLPGFETLLVPNSPEMKASFGVTYIGSRWDGALSGRWVDDFAWAVGPFVGTVDSYTTFDASANFEVNRNFKLGVTVANLLDDQHFESFGGDILERRALGHVTFNW